MSSSAVAFAQQESSFEVGASTSYSWSGEHDGFGGAISANWSPLRFLAIGALVDISRLSTSGSAPQPYRHGVVSAFFAPTAQLRWQLGPFIPYLELAFGYVVVDTVRSEGLRGRFGSGWGLGAAVGAKLIVTDAFALGVRTAARQPAGEGGCLDVLNGAHCPDFEVLLSPAITADLRF